MHTCAIFSRTIEKVLPMIQCIIINPSGFLQSSQSSLFSMNFVFTFLTKIFFFPTVSKHNTSKGKRRQLVQCSCKFTQHIWICNMLRHSSTLAWKIPWMEEPGRLQSMGSRRVGHDWVTSLSLFTFLHWRRKWQPTPVFLPENPRDGGAWWAAVYGVAQSWTWLKWLSSSSSSSRHSCMHPGII